MNWSRGRRAARSALPDGSIDVGLGLVVLGGSSYAFLALASHRLAPASYSGLSVLYVLVYTVGPGLFLPLELELGRGLAHRLAQGDGGGPLLRRAAALGAALLGGVLVVAAIASPWMISRLFNGSESLYAALLVSSVGLYVAYTSRGVLAGMGRFRTYGHQLAWEGLVRMAICVALVVGSVHAAGAYGIALAVAPLAAVAVTGPRRTSIDTTGPPSEWSELSGALGWLLAGSVLSQVLVNSSVVIAKVLSGHRDPAAAGLLLDELVVARLPLFLFAAVQVVLLPRLATLVGLGDRTGLVRTTRAMAVGVGLLGVAATVIYWAVGPPVLAHVFHTPSRIDRTTLLELAAASGLVMVTTVLSQALLALRGYTAAMLGWGAGVAGLVLVVALGTSVVTRVVGGYLVGTVAATIVTFALYLRALPSIGDPATPATSESVPA